MARILIIDSTTEQHFPLPQVEQEFLPGHQLELRHIAHTDELSDALLASQDYLIIWACIPAIQFDAAFLARLPRCRAIVKAAVGYDNINIVAARQQGIAVYNIPDYGTEEVADHAMALLLALARKLPQSDRQVREGGWDWSCVKTLTRLRGRHLGLIGFGRIGSAMARRAQAFGLHVHFYDPHVASGLDKAHGVQRCERLDELLGRCDILSVHADLNPGSHHLLDADAFARMRPQTLLINTARGAIIEREALLAALQQGTLAGAGLDVVEHEPAIPAALRALDNVILTAHSAFYSEAALHEMRSKSATLIRRLLSDEQPRDCVNPLPLTLA